jgi:hypothetical protein
VYFALILQTKLTCMNTLYAQHDTGRVVYRSKGLVTHTGIMAGTDVYGRGMVIHNHPDSGCATVVTFEEFANGKQVFYKEEECTYSPQQVWHRAIAAVNSKVPYRLFDSNCQHLTSHACRGTKESEGLKAAAAIALLFIGGSLLLSNASE